MLVSHMFPFSAIFPEALILTEEATSTISFPELFLYQTILTFNDPKKESS